MTTKDPGARDRLIAAACRVVASERGGLDHANADAEQEIADEILTEAVAAYYVSLVPGAEFSRKVFEALGAASMCWDPTPTGVFQSDRAEEIGNDLLRSLVNP